MTFGVRALAAAAGATLVLVAGVSTASARIVVPDGGLVITGGSLADATREMDVAYTAGAPWVSISASWEALEPEPDAYRTGGAGAAAWDVLQAKLAYAASKGMRVELRLGNSPSWASGVSGRFNDPPTPANRPAYGEFLRDLAARLGPYIDAYSPWNEPNIGFFWSPVDASAYAALQRVAYTALKEIDPSAVVLLGPLAGSSTKAYDYLADAYAAGLRGYVDAVGWSAYPLGPPEQAYGDGQGRPATSALPSQLYLGGLIAQRDPGRKVWLMELSWSTCTNCDGTPGNGATEAEQADYLERAFAYRRRYLTGVTERIFWYATRDTGTRPLSWEENQGLLHHDFSPKPSLAAFRRVGIEVPDGTIPGPGSVATPIGSGSAAATALPAAAAKSLLPAAARSATGRVILGRPTLRARRGIFTVTLRVVVRGGSTRIRFEGYRGRKWRGITTVKVSRSGTLTVRFPDKAYVGVRLRATVPGRKGWRAARVIRVPVRSLIARR